MMNRIAETLDDIEVLTVTIAGYKDQKPSEYRITSKGYELVRHVSECIGTLLETYQQRVQPKKRTPKKYIPLKYERGVYKPFVYCGETYISIEDFGAGCSDYKIGEWGRCAENRA